MRPPVFPAKVTHPKAVTTEKQPVEDVSPNKVGPY